MRGLFIVVGLGLFAASAQAEAPIDLLPPGMSAPAELPPFLQCVPFARQVSGIQIFGDAWTWWNQAEGHYAKGHTPRVGAVMAFRPHGNMTLGHVAAVTGVVDARTVLLTHANWSPIEGRRGQVERDVRAVDVSPANDWSEVRVWYAPLGDLGTTAWPVEGFIYPGSAPRALFAQGSAPAQRRPIRQVPTREAERDVIGDIIRSNS